MEKLVNQEWFWNLYWKLYPIRNVRILIYSVVTISFDCLFMYYWIVTFPNLQDTLVGKIYLIPTFTITLFFVFFFLYIELKVSSLFHKAFKEELLQDEQSQKLLKEISQRTDTLLRYSKTEDL